MAFGLMLSVWPHVEEFMIHVFSDLTGIEDHDSARLIFRSIINQNARISIMKTMLEKSPLHADKPEYFDRLIEEFVALNKLRNGYAHGIWRTDDKTNRVYLETETEAYADVAKRREVTADELMSVAKQMVDLREKILLRPRQSSR
jgi:hypothetical protein